MRAEGVGRTPVAGFFEGGGCGGGVLVVGGGLWRAGGVGGVGRELTARSMGLMAGCLRGRGECRGGQSSRGRGGGKEV